MKEYFSHDYNARNDQKLVSLIRKMGMEGIGIYWCLVEIMYECYGSIHFDKIVDIAFDLHTDSDKVRTILDSELFKKRGKKYFSTSILNRIEKRKEKTNKTRLAALKSWESRRKPNANAKQTESKSNAIILKDIKVKESKVNKEGKTDFLDEILNEFIKAYQITGNDYEVLNKGKERAAIGKLIKLYKTKYPESKSEETKSGLRSYFDQVVLISDNWLSDNMSPSIIVSKFNEINKILKNGTNRQNSKGVTDRELADIIVKHFGNPEQ